MLTDKNIDGFAQNTNIIVVIKNVFDSKNGELEVFSILGHRPHKENMLLLLDREAYRLHSVLLHRSGERFDDCSIDQSIEIYIPEKRVGRIRHQFVLGTLEE